MTTAVQKAPATSAIGRRGELQRLNGALEDARAGHGAFVVISGEAGMGKTHLLKVFGASLSSETPSFWGYAPQTGEAPPLWPWRKLMRDCLRVRNSEHVLGQMDDRAGRLAAFQATLGRQELPRSGQIPGEAGGLPDRYELFEAMAEFWMVVARAGPLVLFFEDLHDADATSLEFLGFLARTLHESPILVVATLRRPDQSPSAEGRRTRTREALLGALGASPSAIHLERFSEVVVGEILEDALGKDVDAALRKQVTSACAGHPLILSEMLQLVEQGATLNSPTLAAGLRASQRIRALMHARLETLGFGGRRRLVLVAVAGARIRRSLLRTVLEADGAPDQEFVDRARAADVLVDEGDEIRFSHALFRDAFLEMVSADERREAHRDLAEALERSPRPLSDEDDAALARHLALAVPLVPAALAARELERVGLQAWRVSAFAEAARLFAQALALLDEHMTSPARRSQLELWHSLSLRESGDGGGAAEACARAADLAEEADLPQELTRAAMAAAPNAVLGGMQHRIIGRLRRGLEGLPPGDSPLRARALATLARELWWGGSLEEIEALGDEAVAMARRLDSPEVLFWVLDVRANATDLPERRALSRADASEMVALAQEHGSRARLARAYRWRILSHLTDGDRNAVEADMEAHAQLAAELQSPLHGWFRALWRNMLAFLDGRFADARRGVEEAGRLEESARAPGITAASQGQMIHLMHEIGDHRTLVPVVEAFAAMNPDAPGLRNLESGFALYNFEMGDVGASRAALERIGSNEFRGMSRWAERMTLQCLAEVCVRLNDAKRAAQILPALERYRGLNLVFDSSILASLGPADRGLGQLYTLIGNLESAESHLRSAQNMIDRLRSPPLRARWLVDWANLRDCAGDGSGARAARDEAAEIADALGMRALVAQIPRVRTAAGKPAVAATRLLRREGELWHIDFEEVQITTRHSIGMQYLALLLMSPGREFHCLELVAAARGLDVVGGAAHGDDWAVGRGRGMADLRGQLTEEQYRDYARRLQVIRESLSDAGPELEKRLLEERALIAEEIARKPDGSPRRSSKDPAERARVSVRRALSRSQERLGRKSNELAAHLTATVRTGLFCCYLPDTTSVASWEVSGFQIRD